MLRLTVDGPVVIFGGTFDPPTTAHAVLPALAAEAIGASQLRYIPASISPHKMGTPPTSPAHRLAMLRMILPSGAEIDTREIDRGGTSFMIETLESIRAEIPSSHSLRLLVGTDHVSSFHRWHRWRDIINLAPPAVMIRDHDEVESVLEGVQESQGDELVEVWRAGLLDLPRMPQASTKVRLCVGQGQNVDADIVPQVAAYIAEHQLYGVPT